ncbi:MAG: alanine racemase [Bacillota bacterium]
MKAARYPVLDINLDKIHENAKVIVELCEKKGIYVTGVFKGAGGMLSVAEEMLSAGCRQIASSRVKQLTDIKKHHEECETMLLRLPMQCEIPDVVRYADISLNSELNIIEAIEKECREQNRKHKVVLMLDLGDLREGFMSQEELIDTAVHIEADMKYVKLAGIGTNLGCYGSVKPTEDNLKQLAEAADKTEEQIGRRLEIVSGGATTSLPLVVEGKIPSKINNLRIGEGILNNMDLPMLWNINIQGMNQDTFLFTAQIIELKEKPSYPIGELFVDAFGYTPHYKDMGIRKRALIAAGAQDFGMYDKLIPIDGDIKLIGSSSDHLIADITDSKKDYKVGDTISFKLFYGPMLFLCCSEYVRKRIVTEV